MENDRPRRVLLKLSGEALGGSEPGINPDTGLELAGEVAQVARAGVEIGIVCGGGNFFRGINADKFKLERNQADAMGMLATMMNGIALGEFIREYNIPVKVYSALPLAGYLPIFTAKTADAELSAGTVLVFCGGTGQSFFSTDTAAALRACQIHADLLLKGTKVDGVFTSDPVADSQASMFKHISFEDVLVKNLRVIDGAAVALCRDQKIPVRVFNLTVPGNLLKAVMDNNIGTLIS